MKHNDNIKGSGRSLLCICGWKRAGLLATNRSFNCCSSSSLSTTTTSTSSSSCFFLLSFLLLSFFLLLLLLCCLLLFLLLVPFSCFFLFLLVSSCVLLLILLGLVRRGFAQTIVERGFDERFSYFGGMFGAGLYFAEVSFRAYNAVVGASCISLKCSTRPRATSMSTASAAAAGVQPTTTQPAASASVSCCCAASRWASRVSRPP